MKVLLPLLIITTFTFSSVFAQRHEAMNARNYSDIKRPGVSIIGTIIDEINKSPLEYATITILNLRDSSLVTGGVTDKKGRFDIKVKPGLYLIKSQFISYQSIVSALNVEADGQITDVGEITLSQNSMLLDDVVVEGEKGIVQMQLDKRVYNVGKNAANLGANAADILDNIPSVQVDIEGNISLRGSENVNILIDGKPSGLVGMSDNNALRQLQGNMIERIEVVTNPSARYDAEGSAGIINIILKKENRKGVNGTIDIGVGYPENYNAATSLNYRLNQINFFANYGIRYNRMPGSGNSLDRYFPANEDTLFYTIRDREHERGGLSHNIRFGSDWFINKYNTLTTAFIYRKSNEENITQNHFLDYNEKNNLLIRSVNRNDKEIEDEDKLEYSLNYKRTFNKKGQSLTAFFQYRDNAEIEDSDIIESSSESLEQLFQKFYNEESEENYLLQFDYVLPISEGSKFETGYKGTIRTTINDYEVSELQANNWTVLDSLSNNFEYNEQIHALYAIYSKQAGKISYQIGLRSEITDIDTHLKDTNEKNDKNYLSFFPSAHVSYEIKKGSDLQVSYSRRLHRPRFRHLNPFSSYSDARNLRTGNPDLDPEYTDSYEFGFLKNWKTGSLLSSIYYNYTSGVVQRIKFAENGTSNSTPYNLGKRNAYGLEFAVSKDIAKWWSISSNFNFYRAIVSGEVEQQNFNSDAYSWNGRFNSKITIAQKLDFQTNFNYRAPRETTQGERKSMYNLDLGLAKDVLQGKGTLTFSVRDLFNTRKYRGTSFGEGFSSESEFQWRSRQFLMGFNYRINRKKTRRNGGSRRGEDNGSFDGDDGGF